MNYGGLLKDVWKYIIYNVNGSIPEQLFNLENDPWEIVNLTKIEEPQFKANAYKRVLKDEMKKNNDLCDLDRHYWWRKSGKIPWREAEKLYVY
jgi:arylsulfatase A-like enzyme